MLGRRLLDRLYPEVESALARPPRPAYKLPPSDPGIRRLYDFYRVGTMVRPVHQMSPDYVDILISQALSAYPDFHATIADGTDEGLRAIFIYWLPARVVRPTSFVSLHLLRKDTKHDAFWTPTHVRCG